MTQQELFDEIQAQPAPAKRREGQPVFAVQRLSWSMSYQQLALASAATIVALVGAFALGVERGKQIARPADRLISPPIVAQAAPLLRPTGGTLPVAASARTAAPTIRTVAATVPAAAPAAPAPVAARPAVRRYTIQLATYTSRAEGERQLAKLKQGGYSAFLNEGNQRVSLCVGDFATREAAGKTLTLFRKKFRDCFIRVR